MGSYGELARIEILTKFYKTKVQDSKIAYINTQER